MTIDIAIPTRGRSSLETLLAALARQRPLPGALIVVDDRPAGAAHEITALVPRALHPSLAIVCAGGRGPAAARNLAWRASRAEWIAFLDDDVVPDPDWLARLGDDLRGLGRSVAASQGTLRVPRPARATDWERSVGGLESAAYITADMAFRVAALRAAQGFDERFPRPYREDSELACRLLAAGWTIVRGTRSVAHPVPPASRLISIERQRGNADDALMRALHGARWRHRAHAAPGRRPLHIATTAAAVTAIAALLLRRGALAKAALSGWGAGTLELAIARVRPGPRTGDEIATMALTSALLPPTATAHWLLGLLRWRVLSRPRPLPTRGPIDEQHEGGEAPPALPHRAVIVLGYHEVRHGRHLLDRVGRAVVRRAESLVAEQAPRAVIFTGWSSRPGPSEAEQMDDLWKGRRDIALIREPRARNTAENATRCLELVKSLDGVSEVVVVCSIRHFPRVRYLFGRLYASEGIAVRYSYVTSPLPSGRLVWHELGSLTRMALDLQRAQAGRPA